MMRKPLMIANWKMNKTRDDALAFIYAVNDSLPSSEFVDTVICAPTIILRDLVKRQGDTLKIGAQNVFYEENGAYTGEISPVMLTSTGVEYVIVGHSERRTYDNETSEKCNLKIVKLLENNFVPVYCVGETLEQFENNKTMDVVKDQIEKGFLNISKEDASKIVVAYEPVWSIGTGKNASKEIAENVCAFIRSLLVDLYDKETAGKVRILYGGSVKPNNIK